MQLIGFNFGFQIVFVRVYVAKFKIKIPVCGIELTNKHFCMKIKLNNKTGLFLFCMLIFSMGAFAQKKSSTHGNKFEQLGSALPTPNSYHAADGSPGPEYWQQRADYDIE